MSISLKDLLNRDLSDINNLYRAMVKMNKIIDSSQFNLAIVDLINRTIMLKFYISHFDKNAPHSEETITGPEELYSNLAAFVKNAKYILLEMDKASKTQEISPTYKKKIEEESALLTKRIVLVEEKLKKLLALIETAKALHIDAETDEIFGK